MYQVVENEKSKIKTFYHLSNSSKVMCDKLDAGIYNLYAEEGMFGVQVSFTQYVEKEKLIEMNDGIFADINKEVSYMFSEECKKIHSDFGYINKLGVLLYGPPGTGKTCYAKLLCNNLVEKFNCIVLYAKPSWLLSNVVELIRKEDPDRNIVFIFEELDRTINDGRGNYTTAMLEFLDGKESVSNVLSIATTNNYNKLSTALTSRPSRFKIKEEVRKIPVKIVNMIIQEKLKEKYLNTSQVAELSYLIHEKECTMDQIKHILLNIVCYKQSIKEAIECVQKEVKVTSSSIDLVD